MHIIFTYNFLNRSNGYKFGFNGQVKDDEIYGEGNTYSAQYWEYDARLGRRWNLDPVDQISISNYACFGNNPIANIDPDGDKWGDENAKKEAKATKKSMRSAITETKTMMTSGQIDAADGKARINDLKAGIKEINKMGRSQAYTFYVNTKFSRPNEGIIEPLGNNSFMIHYDLFSYGKYKHANKGLRAHEFKHGYQFMVGELSAEYDYHDKTDEIAAYKRSMAVMPESVDYGDFLKFEKPDKSLVLIRKMTDIDINFITSLGIYNHIPDKNVNSCNYSKPLISNNLNAEIQNITPSLGFDLWQK